MVGGMSLSVIYNVADGVPSAKEPRMTFTKGSGMKGSSLVGNLVGHGTLTEADTRPKGARAVGFCGVGRTVCLMSLPNCNCTGISTTRGRG